MYKIFFLTLFCLLSCFKALSAAEGADAKEQVTSRLQALIEAVNQNKADQLPSFSGRKMPASLIP